MKIVHYAAPNLTLVGPAVGHVMDANPDITRAAVRLAHSLPLVNFTAYVSPRVDEDDALEWTVSATSPQGRQTYELIQATPDADVRLRTR